jgi:epoxyqueuosine reductase
VSYLTVEYRGSIPEQHRAAIGNHIFGCDVCQEVCPWNGQAVTAADPSWSSRDDVNLASLIELWRRSDRELEVFIGSTPMTRTGVRGLRRNLAVALGNSGDPRALDALRSPADASAADPIVAEHVTWAQSRLSRADVAASAVPSTGS